MNKERLHYNFTEILNDYHSKIINKKEAIKNIMNLGFFKKEAEKIFEEYYG